MSPDVFNLGMLVLRIGVGAVFLAHGIKHARSREKTTNWFASIGFRQAPFQWFMSTATEIGAGVLLILGLFTSLAAAGVVSVMFVAFMTVHRPAGFFITAFMKEGIEVEGWEYVFTLAFTGLAIAILGPGEVSIDDALGIATNLDGWIGALLVGGGIAMGVGELATFWRPTETDRVV